MPAEPARQDAWRRIRTQLKPEVGDDVYRHLLQPLELQEVAARDHAIIFAPTRAQQYWASTHFSGWLLELWRAEDERAGRITITAPPEAGALGERVPDAHCRAVEPARRDAWRWALDRLRLEIGELVFEWLRELELQQVEREYQVTLIAPTNFLRLWTTVHYGERLLELWQSEDHQIGLVTIVAPPLVCDDGTILVERGDGTFLLARGGAAAELGSQETQRSTGAPRTQRNRGGAPAKYDWEALWFELIRIAQIDEFQSRRELRQRALAWIGENWGDGGPSDSVLREKLSRLGDLLDLPEN